MHGTLIRAGQFTQALRQGGVILVALALPRLGLTRADIGEWEGLLYVGYVLGFGWVSGLLQAYLVTARNSGNLLGYSRRVLWWVFGTSLGLLALAGVGIDWVYGLLRLGDAPEGWWWFFVFLLTQWPGFFFEQVLQLTGRVKLLVGFGLFSFAGYSLALILPLALGGEFAEALRWLALFAGAKGLVVLAWSFLVDLPPGEESSHPNALAELWRTASPLMLYATISGLVIAFDPWFVNYWFADDEAVFALFRYGARDVPFVVAITGGMVVVVLPRLTESTAAGLKLLRDSSRRIFHWVFGGVLLLMLSSPLWWAWVFTEAFAEALPLFHLFLFITLSRLLFPGPVLIALGHTRGLWLFPLAELSINALLSLALAPLFGLWGIVLATVVADTLGKAILMGYLYLRTGISPGRYTDFGVYGAWSTALLVGYGVVNTL